MYFNYLDQVDPAIAQAIRDESSRQQNKIEMIASENFTSRAVMEACGCEMTNKYAEGYPGKRYYGGCEYVDVAEKLAIERVKELFGAEHANVQAHCGASANLGVYLAMLKPGDTVMGMDLSNGGHLSHGSPVNISGMYFNFVSYGIDPETEVIDYEDVRKVALENKPKLIVAGASAYPRIIDFKKFREIADEVGAYLMVDMAHIAGLVAGGDHPNPVEYADFVTTTTHKTLRGPRGGVILCKEEYAKAIDKAMFPGLQGGPLMHIIAGKAVCFQEALQPEFKEYSHQIVRNAQAMAEALKKYDFEMVSGGTDNHLVLVKLVNKGLTGKVAEKLLDEAGITTNKNSIPNDPNGPFITSGLRLGTPAMTTRGFVEEDVQETIRALAMVLNEPENEAAHKEASEIVRTLCEKHPLYR